MVTSASDIVKKTPLIRIGHVSCGEGGYCGELAVIQSLWKIITSRMLEVFKLKIDPRSPLAEKVVDQCQKAKEQLATNQSALYQLFAFGPQCITVTGKITRDELEQECASQLMVLHQALEKALAEAQAAAAV